jgi:hypothetical protein
VGRSRERNRNAQGIEGDCVRKRDPRGIRGTLRALRRRLLGRLRDVTADADLAPLFKGLPDDRCQCPHWGYVVKGKVSFTFADGHEETYEGGDAYFAPPGHLPRLYAGSEVVEFHPTAELAKTMEVVERNMAAGA